MAMLTEATPVVLTVVLMEATTAALMTVVPTELPEVVPKPFRLLLPLLLPRQPPALLMPLTRYQSKRIVEGGEYGRCKRGIDNV